MTARSKTKNRMDAGTFFALPHAVLDSHNYLALSHKSVKLLNDVGRQYNGYNNGDFSVTHSLMRKRGWVSKSTLAEALEELIYYDFVLLTRQGGRNKTSLYAITWYPVNECKGKLDITATNTAPGTWKEVRKKFIPKRVKKK